MRKFYQSVAVTKSEGGYAVQLDGKPVKTPAQQPLVVATAALAEAMADEWRAQGEKINPDTMPITRIVTIAIDRVPHDRAALIDEITRYAGTDLLCYRAPSSLGLEKLVLNVPIFRAPSSPSVRARGPKEERGAPAPSPAGGGRGVGALGGESVPHDAPLLTSPLWGEGYAPHGDNLRALQDLHFTPILTWAAGQGIRLEVTEGITPIPQPEASLMRVREMVAAAEDIELAALAMATPLLGSAILALALWQGLRGQPCSSLHGVPRALSQPELGLENILRAARLDEAHQAAQWGEDAEANAQWGKRARDIRGAAAVLKSGIS
jgi:chaperone required for assembly of F1-ATPase